MIFYIRVVFYDNSDITLRKMIFKSFIETCNDNNNHEYCTIHEKTISELNSYKSRANFDRNNIIFDQNRRKKYHTVTKI